MVGPYSCQQILVVRRRLLTTAALGGLTTLGGLEGIRIWSRIHQIHTLKDSNLSNPKLSNLAHPYCPGGLCIANFGVLLIVLIFFSSFFFRELVNFGSSKEQALMANKIQVLLLLLLL